MKKILGITSIIVILLPLAASPTRAFASETADSSTESESVLQAPAEDVTPEIEPPEIIEDTETPEVTPPVEETTETPEVPSAEETTETPEVPSAEETTETPEVPSAEETTEIPEVPSAEETTETPEIPSAEDNSEIEDPAPPVEEETEAPAEEPTTPETIEGTSTVPEMPTQKVVSEPTTAIDVPSNSAAFYFSHQLTTEQFVLKIGEQAREVGQNRNIYASVMIAQAILESGSGSSQLSNAPNYNLFGIKGSYNGKSVLYGTQEDDGFGNLYSIQAGFRVYENYQQSLEDYADLLTNGLNGDSMFYAGCWKENAETYREATRFLQGRYATDTTYAAKLDGLIEAYNLTIYDEPAALSEGETEGTQAIKVEALQYLGTPYVWGGTTEVGFDCSGLVQHVFKNALNIALPRVTTDQEQVGVNVSLTAVRTGDLLFWGAKGATTHVAIYIGKGQFIHAPQTGDVVKITAMTDFMPDFAQRLLE